MLIVEYNLDEASKGGIGCVLYTTEGVTVTKHSDGTFSAEFVDEDGGCLTRVCLEKRVLLALMQLSDHPEPRAVIQLEYEETPQMARLRQQSSELDEIEYPF